MSEARRKGHKAALLGKPKGDNPYPPNYKRHAEWAWGWLVTQAHDRIVSGKELKS